MYANTGLPKPLPQQRLLHTNQQKADPPERLFFLNTLCLSMAVPFYEHQLKFKSTFLKVSIAFKISPVPLTSRFGGHAQYGEGGTLSVYRPGTTLLSKYDCKEETHSFEAAHEEGQDSEHRLYDSTL